MNRHAAATDALLSLAAAQTPQEVAAARRDLIATGGAMLLTLDRSRMVVGDGSAGRGLLAGQSRRDDVDLQTIARRCRLITSAILVEHAVPGGGS